MPVERLPNEFEGSAGIDRDQHGFVESKPDVDLQHAAADKRRPSPMAKIVQNQSACPVHRQCVIVGGHF